MPVISQQGRWFPPLPLADILCVGIIAFFAVQGSVPFIAPNQALEVRNVPGSGLTYWGGIGTQLVVYATICGFHLDGLRTTARWIGTMRWAGVLALFAVASSAWSQFPEYTLRRSIPFALAACFGMIFAVRFPIQRQLSILWMAMLVVAMGSVVMALGFPRLGLDSSAGHASDWQGVFTSKNACGRIMVLATAVTLSQPVRTIPRVFSLLFFLVVLVMSGSRGAWAVEAAVLAIFCAFHLLRLVDLRSRLLLLALALILSLGGLAFGISHVEEMARMMGRDATLTGRTEIWRHVWPFVWERPILGWGYAGFFRGTQGEVFRLDAAMRFVIFHAHNGFLEIWLELGAAGLFLFIGSYLRGCRKLLKSFGRGGVEGGMWLLFVLALVVLYDLDENTLLIYNGLFWMIYVAALVNIELISVEEKLASRIALLTQREDDERLEAAA